MYKTTNFCGQSELLAVVSKTFHLRTRIATAKDTYKRKTSNTPDNAQALGMTASALIRCTGNYWTESTVHLKTFTNEFVLGGGNLPNLYHSIQQKSSCLKFHTSCSRSDVTYR